MSFTQPTSGAHPPQGAPPSGPDAAPKADLREAALMARRAVPAATRAAWDAEIVASAVELARGRGVVAAYLPLADEPGGERLVPALAAVVQTLLLPVLLPSNDLDWAAYVGAVDTGRRGVRHPPGPRLGVGAVADTSLVIVPALGVSLSGVRLGRGGGSYDRALARVPAGTPIVALLYADELRAELPAEPHDQPVTAALTPAGLRALEA